MMMIFIFLKDDWIDGVIFRLFENRFFKKQRNFLLKYRKKYLNLKVDKNDFFLVY